MENSWHEKGERLGNGLVNFSGLGLVASAIVKFIHPDKVVAYLGFLGYDHATISVIAGIELFVGLVFLIRATRPLGLLLVSSYFGGAISAHLANHPSVAGGPFLMFAANHHYLSTIPADALLVAAWIGTYLLSPRALSGTHQRRATEKFLGKDSGNLRSAPHETQTLQTQ